jgi:hypothetical protein
MVINATQGREIRKLGSALDYAAGSVQAVTEDGHVLIASNSICKLKLACGTARQHNEQHPRDGNDNVHTNTGILLGQPRMVYYARASGGLRSSVVDHSLENSQ